MLNKISSQQAHDIIQKAAQAGWHPSHMKNGINLDKSIHNGWDAAHATYSRNLTNHIESKKKIISSAQDAKDFLEDLQSKIRIQFNAGKKLDEIIF